LWTLDLRLIAHRHGLALVLALHAPPLLCLNGAAHTVRWRRQCLGRPFGGKATVPAVLALVLPAIRRRRCRRRVAAVFGERFRPVGLAQWLFAQEERDDEPGDENATADREGAIQR